MRTIARSFHNRRLQGGILVAVFCILSFGSSASAQTLKIVADAAVSGKIIPLFLLLVGAVISIVVTLLFQLDMLLAHILISLAQFNTFVNATPVVIGWPLVRDVVNMFFIVLLLVIAFSTIIGYQEFHYKQHLPKLLLMSVLINFSKTLVGLLIDFSQVITLTFVNGFQQAAFGNFAKAFQLTKLLNSSVGFAEQVRNGDADLSRVAQTLQNTLIAFMFGIVILTITATVLIIMIVYFMARIVGLWLLLIMSPIAFFALAVPSKLGKSLASFTGSWWKQLGAWLSGGPIVAFFLWLTLAVVQGGAGFGNLYTPGSPNEEAQYTATITEVGSPANITTFIVAIVMLLSGLNAAVSISKEASPQLGALAEGIKKSGGPGTIAARLAYRGTAKAAVGTARFADKKLNITGQIGAGLQARGLAASRGGGFVGRALGATIAGAGVRVSGISAERRVGVATAFQKETGHMGPAQQLGQLEARYAQAQALKDREAMDVLQVQRAKILSNPAGLKARQKQLEEQYKTNVPKVAGQTDTDWKMKAEGVSKDQAKSELRQNFADAIKSAEEGGDAKTAAELREKREKNPSYYQDPSDIKGDFDKWVDLKKGLGGVNVEAFGDNAVWEAFVASRKLKDPATGKMITGYAEDEAMIEFNKNPVRKAYGEAHIRSYESEEGRARANAIATGSVAARQTLTKSGDYMIHAGPAGPGAVRLENVSEARRTLNQTQNQYVQNNAAVYANPPTPRAAGAPPLTPPAQAERNANIQILAQGQAQGIPAPRQAQPVVVDYAMEQVRTDDPETKIRGAAAIANIETEGIADSPEVQQALVDALEGKIDGLADAFNAAKRNPEVLKKMEGMMKSVAKASEKAVAKAISQPMSALEMRLDQISTQMQKHKDLNKVFQRKKKET